MQEAHLKARLAASYDYFQAMGHQQNMHRIKQLAEKLTRREYGIAFAGHFSAGKSRMINSLLGENLLPSSPIPTSANLVRVHRGARGKNYARVYFHQEKPRKYLAPYDYDMLRGYCRDGDQIAEIELCRSDLSLPEQVVIMDTPGIDSADDAHRASTEAALHLADIIFYVMDYNHVQAELNLSFTKELTNAGKTVYLVINQIDKHVDSELSFEQFCQGVEKAFLSWGVKPAGFYYTSLRYPEHEHNQFAILQKMLQEKIAARYELLTESIDASLQKIWTEFAQEEEKSQNEQLASAREALAALSPERNAQLQQDYERLSKEMAELTEDWEDSYKQGAETILDNAYLMPTSTRDLARDYLEACQPDFKVGFFGRGKKTMAELERRKKIFFEDATEKAEAQLSWHIKTYLTDFARKYHLTDERLLSDVQAMQILPPEELLTDAMRSGAKLTKDGSYVMNYTANFAEGTKRVARRYIDEFKDRIGGLITARREARQAEVMEQLATLSDYHEAWAAEAQARKHLTEIAIARKERLSTENMPYLSEDIFALAAIDEEIVAPMDGSVPEGVGHTDAVATTAESGGHSMQTGAEQAEVTGEPSENSTNNTTNENHDKKVGKEAIAHWAGKLHKAAELLGEIPVLAQLRDELEERAGRLENKSFMVTLFGAFSAGKSSFANSLLGEALLPVSPNPTTAAINKICPVDAEHPHGTVIVKLKDEAMLLADVNRALKPFRLSAMSTADALVHVETALSDSSNAKQREKAFLRAFLAGYGEAKGHLGEELRRELADFPAYAAQEEKSCFVDWLEVYYDCPFTQLGITLVDTPGADSINARHTNMSFNYIRQSDAVLFVTYYNHAFSRADREFLIQLGRVKDAFALDKMFFIVNAIDLAENDEEAQGVIGYVADQLKKFGVRRPQMFGLSSQQILKEKLGGKKDGFAFETAFYKFVFEELTSIAVNAASTQYELARDQLQELIRFSKGSKEEKEARRNQLRELQKQVQQVVNGMSSTELQQRQQQETSELVYYVKQRVFLRYTDFFRESFNPATLQGRSGAQEKLQQALEELLESLGFDLAQELRATTLRMEQFISKQIYKLQQDVNGRLLEIDSELPISLRDFTFDSNIEYETAFKNLDRNIFAKALTIYKNPKSFFEEGQFKEMAAALEQILSAQADTYLQAEIARLKPILTESTEQLFKKAQSRFTQLTEEGFRASFSALEGGVPVEKLERIAGAL